MKIGAYDIFEVNRTKNPNKSKTQAKPKLGNKPKQSQNQKKPTFLSPVYINISPSDHASPSIIKILYNTGEYCLSRIAPSYVENVMPTSIRNILQFIPFCALITSIHGNLKKLLKKRFFLHLTLKMPFAPVFMVSMGFSEVRPYFLQCFVFDIKNDIVAEFIF